MTSPLRPGGCPRDHQAPRGVHPQAHDVLYICACFRIHYVLDVPTARRTMTHACLACGRVNTVRLATPRRLSWDGLRRGVHLGVSVAGALACGVALGFVALAVLDYLLATR